jgi:uncharacterized protein involved in response to NO
MATSAEQMRSYAGPALLTGGFRPFFLFGAAWAAIAILLWIPMFEGHITLPTAFSPLDWHIHELLYGYLAAAIAGFLLTAIPNWTGRLPVVGRPLAVLVGLWAAGRLAVLVSGWIGAELAAVIDLSFLAALVAVAGREVWASGNRRNLPVVGLLALLFVGNLVFHLETSHDATAAYGTRIGIAGALLLVSLIGGRIVPSFTINWLRNRPKGPSATPFARFDKVVIAVSAVALAIWVARPDHAATGIALLVAGVLQTARLARWAGWRTWGEKLVFVLHVAYGFLALGFLLMGTSLLGLSPLPQSAALHAWTIGALALMTLAVMTRASLGHTGRALTASARCAVAYGALVFAALLRPLAELVPGQYHALLSLSAACWLVAFGLFVIEYGPILATAGPRKAR